MNFFVFHSQLSTQQDTKIVWLLNGQRPIRKMLSHGIQFESQMSILE